MVRVMTDPKGLEQEFLDAYNNTLYFWLDILTENKNEIIDWCNKNLTNYIFLDDYIDMKRMETLKDVVYYCNNHPGIAAYPRFRFVEITDMMAFKLRWSNLIITFTHTQA